MPNLLVSSCPEKALAADVLTRSGRHHNKSIARACVSHSERTESATLAAMTIRHDREKHPSVIIIVIDVLFSPKRTASFPTFFFLHGITIYCSRQKKLPRRGGMPTAWNHRDCPCGGKVNPYWFTRYRQLQTRESTLHQYSTPMCSATQKRSRQYTAYRTCVDTQERAYIYESSRALELHYTPVQGMIQYLVPAGTICVIWKLLYSEIRSVPSPPVGQPLGASLVEGLYCRCYCMNSVHTTNRRSSLWPLCSARQYRTVVGGKASSTNRSTTG